jgi:sterol desaturase/sphingolipid hydroxylase (fatty acid hydroxylase superfamily)
MFTKSVTDLAVPDFQLPQLSVEDWRMLAVLSVLPLLMVAEAFAARKERRAKDYRQSYLANFGTLLLNDTLLSLVSLSSLWLLASQYSQWGLLAAVRDDTLKAALSFVGLDLTLYAWHWANHKWDWLWMFHKVHHSDRVMNVSTAFRLHFVEVLMTLAVKACFIVAAGVSAEVVVAHETLITLFVMFHHANFEFWGERWLARVIIVPQLHRVHHSVRRAEHDNNYGAVFSIWDRLFGTLLETEPKEIGLKHVAGQNLLELVKFGLSRQVGPSAQLLRAMIAEAAYYRAEKRGFAPGDEFRDWMEAEREVLGL